MTKRTGRSLRRQEPSRPFRYADVAHLRQLLFPTVAGVVETCRRLTAWVHDVGLATLEELLEVSRV